MSLTLNDADSERCHSVRGMYVDASSAILSTIQCVVCGGATRCVSNSKLWNKPPGWMIHPQSDLGAIRYFTVVYAIVNNMHVVIKYASLCRRLLYRIPNALFWQKGLLVRVV